MSLETSMAGDKQAWARWEAERALESGFHSVLGDRQRVLSWEVRGSGAHVNETVWLRVGGEVQGWRRRSLWTCYLRPLLSSVTGWESEPI